MATTTAPLGTGVDNGAVNYEKTRGGTLGAYGPMTPAEGYGPISDDPVSYQRYFTKIANPGPAGIWSFAMTVFLYAFYTVSTRGVHSPNLIIGMGLFVGGLVQFMAGMWEFPRGNVFGSTFFSLYGAFWISYAITLIPGTGASTAFSASNEFNNALGLYFIVWFVITILFMLSVVRRNISFTALLFFWAMTFLFLAIGNWNVRHRVGITKAAGAFGFITGIIGFYIGFSQLLAAEMSAFFRMPTGHLGRRPVGASRV